MCVQTHVPDHKHQMMRTGIQGPFAEIYLYQVYFEHSTSIICRYVHFTHKITCRYVHFTQVCSFHSNHTNFHDHLCADPKYLRKFLFDKQALMVIFIKSMDVCSSYSNSAFNELKQKVDTTAKESNFNRPFHLTHAITLAHAGTHVD